MIRITYSDIYSTVKRSDRYYTACIPESKQLGRKSFSFSPVRLSCTQLQIFLSIFKCVQKYNYCCLKQHILEVLLNVDTQKSMTP